MNRLRETDNWRETTLRVRVQLSAIIPGKTRLGIAIVTLSVCLFVIMDAGAKALITTYPVVEIIFMRNVIALFPLAVFSMGLKGGLSNLKIKSWKFALTRGLFISMIQGLFFYSLLWLPLAVAVALFFTGPLFITALSSSFLNEKVGPARWSAVIVGFVGVVIICGIGTDFFTIYSLLPLGCALIYAFVLMMVRYSPHEDSSTAVTFYGNLGAAFVCLLFLPFEWVQPQTSDFPLFLMIGFAGAFGALALNAGYRYAPAAVLAPIDYLALPLAFCVGYIFWGEVLPQHFWIGAVLVTAAGLFIAIREARAPKAGSENELL